MREAKKLKKQISPYLLIAMSFLIVVIIGTILLWIPLARVDRTMMSFTEALFLATSSVTVTGLVPDTHIIPSLSVFGKMVNLVLMQIGGLGVITVSVFIMSVMGAKIGIANRVLLRENFNAPTMSGVVKLMRKIVIYTFVIELVGIIINMFVFLPVYPFFKALEVSALMTISSFNNAGFDLYYAGTDINFVNNPLFAFNTMILIMIGSIGLIVVFDVLNKRSWKKFSIHSKIVLGMNAIIWILGALIVKLGQNGGEFIRWDSAFHVSIAARTAGTNVYDSAKFTTFSLLFVTILMFIGGSPASTAGGIKTTTLFTLIKTVFGSATGREVTTQKRRISEASQSKAFMLFFVVASSVITGTLLLLLFDKTPVGDTLFLVMSASTNTGFSTIALEDLSLASHLVLVVLMFVGRVGPFTVIMAFNHNWYKRGAGPITYLEESIIIG